jgi:hypothetical protein
VATDVDAAVIVLLVVPINISATVGVVVVIVVAIFVTAELVALVDNMESVADISKNQLHITYKHLYI